MEIMLETIKIYLQMITWLTETQMTDSSKTNVAFEVQNKNLFCCEFWHDFLRQTYYS